MTTAADVRLLYAAVLTALVAALMYGLTAGAGVGDFGAAAFSGGVSGEGAGSAVEADSALPSYAAHLPACAVGDARPTCPVVSADGAASFVGRITTQVGIADGRLAPGAVDRFNLLDPHGVSSISLEGDLGTVLGVYAAGHALLDPLEGRASLSGSLLPADGRLVQIVVVNTTDAARSYRVVLG